MPLPGNFARCTGTSTQSGKPCQNPAIKGATVCRKHGGSFPEVRAAAARRVAEAKTQRSIASLTEKAPGDLNPIFVLDDMLKVAWALTKAMEKLVAELEDVSYEGKTGEQIRGQITVMMQMMAMTQKFAADMIKLDLAGRKLALEQAQAVALVTAITAILNDLNLTRKQQIVAGKSVPLRLKELEGNRQNASK